MTTRSILGVKAEGTLEAEELEVWELGSTTSVTYRSQEFTSLCPVTLQPDLYTLEISYTAPATFESKGMKHYLWGFRDKGISCEDLAHTIATQLSGRIGYPVTARLVQQSRGGLVLTAETTAAP